MLLLIAAVVGAIFWNTQKRAAAPQSGVVYVNPGFSTPAPASPPSAP
jgi:hypothetical protein